MKLTDRQLDNSMALTDTQLSNLLLNAKPRHVQHVDVPKSATADARSYLTAFKKNYHTAEETKMLDTTKTPPPGVDHKIWEGVLVGINAMRKRSGSGTTVALNIERYGQNLFTLPNGLMLNDKEAETATVVLNGRVCVAGRDYTLGGNCFNWVADRNLTAQDAIAIRYTSDAPAVCIPAQVPTTDTDAAVLDVLAKMAVRVSELETVTEDVSNSIDHVSCQVATIGELVEASDPALPAETTTAPIDKEAEMIEQGVKVWHRLTGEGPWIVIQPTVLNIKSRQVSGEENRSKSSFVELAWSVQTEDGVKDFPEVVLTARPPKKESLSWPKKIALGVGAAVATAAIVHAPTLLKMAGLIQ